MGTNRRLANVSVVRMVYERRTSLDQNLLTIQFILVIFSLVRNKCLSSFIVSFVFYQQLCLIFIITHKGNTEKVFWWSKKVFFSNSSKIWLVLIDIDSSFYRKIISIFTYMCLLYVRTHSWRPNECTDLK